MSNCEEPSNLGSDLKFWHLSFEIQIQLGRTREEAKVHADDYIRKLQGADKIKI